MTKLLAKNVNFINGVPSLGSKLSLQAKHGNTLEVTQFGVIATSKGTGRSVLIPFSNISGVDLVTEAKPKTLEPVKNA